MATIELQNLAHSYDGDTFALTELNHVWRQGGAYALLGPSGCGKSTLLNIISGLISPSQGNVIFDDKRVNDDSPQTRNIAQVFQFPVVYDGMTVRQNLAFPLKNMQVEASKIDARVKEIAALLDLSKILDNKAKNLSADDKQKISMARGLVREDVSAILFDEPLTVIDPHLKWKLRRKLKEIHEKLDITMIYVTHDQLEAATFADEIAVMYEGKIVQFGTPQTLFEQPNHTFVGYFIGSPGMNFLPVSYQNDRLRYAETEFKITFEQRHALNQGHSSNIKLGIRPEFIQLVEQGTPNSFVGHIDVVEALGTHTIITINFLNTSWQIRCMEDFNPHETECHFVLPPQHLKLYMDEYLVGETIETSSKAT